MSEVDQLSVTFRDHERDVGQLADRAGKCVARLERANASRGAGIDRVSGRQMIHARQIGDQFGNRPDQGSAAAQVRTIESSILLRLRCIAAIGAAIHSALCTLHQA